MQTKGQFRIGYLIQVIFVTIVLLVPIVFLLQDDGTNSILNTNRYWFALIAFIWLFGGAFFFMVRNVYFITIGERDQGITFTSLLGRTFNYKFEDITRINSKSATLKRRYYSSPGYQVLTLEFMDGEELEISANIYRNFDRLKGQIYRNAGDMP